MSKNQTVLLLPPEDDAAILTPADEAGLIGGGSVDDDFSGVREDEGLTLAIADLVQDGNGEVVLFNDSHLPALTVLAPSQPVDSGEAGRHVTAAGDDVTGFRFVAFDDGTKLFYQEPLDLLIVEAAAG